MKLQPMLASPIETEADLERLPYPMFVSPKLDGIRLRIDPVEGGVSRTHKRIPNLHIQQIIAANPWLRYMDGEVIVGNPTAPDAFNKTQSAVMSQLGNPPFSYYVFDHWFHGDTGYDLRLSQLKDIVLEHKPAFDCFHPATESDERGDEIQGLHLVPQDVVRNSAEVLSLESKYLELGYEGLIVRRTNGRYKNGRSTFKEAHLLKFKRVYDCEVTIVGFEALERNDNAPTVDAFGHQKRSSHKAGKRADNMLGNFIVSSPDWGTFRVGSGLDDGTRIEIWNNQDKYLGKQATIKYQKAGMKDKPRFPIFKGIRHD